MKKHLKILITTFLTALFLIPATVSALTPAQIQVCQGSGGTISGTTCIVPGSPGVSTIVTKAIILFSVAIGLVAVVMVMIGALKYITSQGDPSQIASAKNTLLYAFLGLVIAALAQALVKFVLNKVG